MVETPVVTWSVERATREPEAEERVVAGEPTTVVRPPGAGPWPAVVFVNGATAFGRHHPQVQGLAHGLARAGYLALVPDLPGLREGEITTETLAATLAVSREAAASPDARDGRITLVGVSVGASLALVAAQNGALAGRVAVVSGIAPYADLVNVLRLATTGHYEDEDGRLLPYDAAPFVSLVAARSLVAGLPRSADRDTLLGRLRAIDDDADDPLADLRAGRHDKVEEEDVVAVLRLLANEDPALFDQLYAALPAELRTGQRRLSPIAGAATIRAPVELASAPEDRYFPLAESRRLEAAAPDVRVTVTTVLEHAIPEPSPRALADLFRFDAFTVRTLLAASSG